MSDWESDLYDETPRAPLRKALPIQRPHFHPTPSSVLSKTSGCQSRAHDQSIWRVSLAIDAPFKMHPSHNTLSIIAFLLAFLFCAPIQAFAVPWAGSSGGFSATQRHPEQSSKHRSVFPQLTWLRDTAIEKVFGLPSKAVSLPSSSYKCSTNLND